MKTVLNDLYDYPNMKIYQLEEGFKFSLDSLLLAEFVNVRNPKEVVVDFCTGNGVVPLVLSSKYSNKIWGIELQEPIYQVALKSIEINQKTSQITIINDNVLNSPKYFKPESVDIITCNPPYFKYNGKSLINTSEIKSIARHEITLDLDGIIKMTSSILKNKGELYLVYVTNRLEELMQTLTQNNLHIKKLIPIYTKKGKNCELILIKAVKNSNAGIKILPAVYIEELETFQNIFKEV